MTSSDQLPGGPDKPAPPRGNRRRWVNAAFAVVAVTLLVVAVWGQREEFLEAAARLSWQTLLGAFLLGCVALCFNAAAWSAAMRGVGAPLPVAWAARVFFVSQIGKYVPGSVWPVVTQVEMTRRRGISRSASSTGSLVAMAVGVVTSACVAAAILVTATPDGARTYWYLLALIPVGLVVLSPPVLSRVLGLVARVTRRSYTAPTISWRGLAGAVAWSLAMWCAFGAHAWLILRGLAATSGEAAPGIVLSTGAFAFAWLVGFLVFLAPAGVGAREAALVLAFAGTVEPADALVLAIVSRVLLTLVDALAALLGILMGRHPSFTQEDR